jgi:CheY-like chemotaxis protein
MKPTSSSLSPSSKPAEDLMVLYVEDQAENWEVTKLRLRGKYKLMWARTDQEACALVRNYGPSLYAILMDIQLQGSALDGLALTRLFRGKATGPLPDYAQSIGSAVTCPIFFVTAYGNVYSPEEMTAAGGDSHVFKPVDFVKLNLLLAQTNTKRVMEGLKL